MWKVTNVTRFEGQVMSGCKVLAKVKNFIASLHVSCNKCLPKGPITAECLLYFDIMTSDCHKCCVMVLWRSQSEHWVKLNTDGASRGNPWDSGGGGILRDQKGIFIQAYHAYFGNSSSMVSNMHYICLYCHENPC